MVGFSMLNFQAQSMSLLASSGAQSFLIGIERIPTGIESTQTAADSGLAQLRRASGLPVNAELASLSLDSQEAREFQSASLDDRLDAQFAQAAQRLEQVITAKGSAQTSTAQLFELEAIRTALMVTSAELVTLQKEVGVGQFAGIDDYIIAVPKRMRTLQTIQKQFSQGNKLSIKLHERWQRLRMSFLGDASNQHRSQWQQHLDHLSKVEAEYPDAANPLAVAMLERQQAYRKVLNELAALEEGHVGDVEMAQKHEAARTEALRTYMEAVEAYYNIQGYMPANSLISRADRTQILKGIGWNPLTWAPTPILGVFNLIGRAMGLQPLSWDGAQTAKLDRHWDGDTLVMKAAYPLREGESLSQRALIAGLLETIRLQFAVVKTAELDDTGLIFDGVVRGWLGALLAETGCTLRVEGLEKLNGFRDKVLIKVPTHLGFTEYPLSLGLADDFGQPHRIIAKAGFRDNPVIRMLVGKAMEAFKFIFIDRSAKDSREVMRQSGQRVQEGPFSVETFPSGSRTPTLMINGQRVEGPHYRSRTGIGDMSTAAGEDVWILPLVFDGSGVFAPKSMGEVFKGFPLGGAITVRVGTPFQPNREVRAEGMDDDQFARAVGAHIDQEHHSLGGQPIGPLYGGKGYPETIFQADNVRALRRQILKRMKHKKGYRESLVVFTGVEMPGERAAINAMLDEVNFPEGNNLIVSHAVEDGQGGYRFEQYTLSR